MKKWLKNEVCGFVNSAWVHYSRENNQKLQILFMNNCLKLMKHVKRKRGREGVNVNGVAFKSVSKPALKNYPSLLWNYLDKKKSYTVEKVIYCPKYHYSVFLKLSRSLHHFSNHIDNFSPHLHLLSP